MKFLYAVLIIFSINNSFARGRVKFFEIDIYTGEKFVDLNGEHTLLYACEVSTPFLDRISTSSQYSVISLKVVRISDTIHRISPENKRRNLLYFRKGVFSNYKKCSLSLNIAGYSLFRPNLNVDLVLNEEEIQAIIDNNI